MFKLSKKCSMGVFTVLVFTLFSASSIALVGISEEGNWPASWPKQLEPYRKQAGTMQVATGIRENA